MRPSRPGPAADLPPPRRGGRPALLPAALLAGVIGALSLLAGCAGARSPVAAGSPSSPAASKALAPASPPASSPPARPAPSLARPTRPRTTISPRPAATPSTRRPVPSPTAAPPVGPAPAAAAGYVFPVAGCRTSYGRVHHDYPATDVFTGRGCAFVAVTAGRVDEVSFTDRWSPTTDLGADRGGRSVSIVGDDGVRYYGSHLLSIAAGIVPGARVRAGQLLGSIDNSGDARFTPTHVHFGISWPTGPGIWWVRRGELYPWPYLDSWRAGGSLSPAGAVARLHAQLGTVPPCTVLC